MPPKGEGSSAGNGLRSKNRRTLLQLLAALGGATAGALLALPAVGFLFAPIFRSAPRRWRALGSIDDFTVGATVLVSFRDASVEAWAGVTGRTGAWLRRVSEQEFVAFAINCTHLGCPVRWEDGPELFMCPCHGGVYHADGSVAAGPPPEPLRRYPVRIRKRTVEIESTPLPIT
jgi:menaquinol-cytochrome c reductase iron-sulfur subunit